MGQPYYKLNFSNYEIENAFQAYFVGSLEERSPLKVSCEMAKLHRTTLANDTATIHLVLKSHLAAIPYVKRRNTEENYHKIIYSVFRLL